MTPRTPGRSPLRLTPLESRLTPADASTAGVFATGVADGQAGDAVLRSADGTEMVRVAPFGADFTHGCRVAVGDVTGDGVPDLVTAVGKGGGSAVKVYDGSSKELIASFTAYEEQFRGGVTLAVADLTGDGKAEIVTGADVGGGPRVRVFDGATVGADGGPSTVADFLAIDDANFRGGVRLALGDVTGDGTADLVVGAGYGGGPRVAVFDGASVGAGSPERVVSDFFAYEPGLRNGIHVGVGDVNGDGKGDLVFGAGPGGGPRVRVADGAKVLARGGGGSLDDHPDEQLADFFAGDEASRDGVQVGTTPDGTGKAAVVGLDVATEKAQVFQTDGTVARPLQVAAGDKTGFFATAPFDKSATPAAASHKRSGSDDAPDTDEDAPPSGDDAGTGDDTAPTPPPAADNKATPATPATPTDHGPATPATPASQGPPATTPNGNVPGGNSAPGTGGRPETPPGRGDTTPRGNRGAGNDR